MKIKSSECHVVVGTKMGSGLRGDTPHLSIVYGVSSIYNADFRNVKLH